MENAEDEREIPGPKRCPFPAGGPGKRALKRSRLCQTDRWTTWIDVSADGFVRDEQKKKQSCWGEKVHGTAWREESKRGLDVNGGCCSDGNEKRTRNETKEQTSG